MNVTSNIAMSGMNAAQTRLQASAHNIANLETQGFVRQDVMQSDKVSGTKAMVGVNANGAGASMESDLVYQMQAKNDFLANLSVLKTGDSMLGALLSVRA